MLRRTSTSNCHAKEVSWVATARGCITVLDDRVCLHHIVKVWGDAKAGSKHDRAVSIAAERVVVLSWLAMGSGR